jgi:hypothetical protein
MGLPRAGLEELVEHLAPESIDPLDMGGDILARGGEPTLKSPLADAVTLAACCQDARRRPPSPPHRRRPNCP